MLGKGMASTHLVKKSIPTKMYLCPFDNEGLISPIMYKSHPLKVHDFTIECNSLAGICWIPEYLLHS